MTRSDVFFLACPLLSSIFSSLCQYWNLSVKGRYHLKIRAATVTSVQFYVAVNFVNAAQRLCQCTGHHLYKNKCNIWV